MVRDTRRCLLLRSQCQAVTPDCGMRTLANVCVGNVSLIPYADRRDFRNGGDELLRQVPCHVPDLASMYPRAVSELWTHMAWDYTQLHPLSAATHHLMSPLCSRLRSHLVPRLQTTIDADDADEDDDEFLDPVTGEVIVDPVIASDGNTYDRCGSVASPAYATGLRRRGGGGLHDSDHVICSSRLITAALTCTETTASTSVELRVNPLACLWPLRNDTTCTQADGVQACGAR